MKGATYVATTMLALGLLAAGAPRLLLAAHGASPETKEVSPADRFDLLDAEFTTRFHLDMLRRAENLSKKEIEEEASRQWAEFFANHMDAVRGRAEALLAALPDAPPLDPEMFTVVARHATLLPPPTEDAEDEEATVPTARVEPAEAFPREPLLKHIAWNPLETARRGLDRWLDTLLTRRAKRKRETLLANVPCVWEAADRRPDAPALVLRQGPMVYRMTMLREGDFYRITAMEWMRPASMRPMRLRKPGRPRAKPRPDDTRDQDTESEASDVTPSVRLFLRQLRR